MVKIRLSRKGRIHKPFYYIVVADVRAPRDGRFLEKVGTYNPMTSPSSIHVKIDRVLAWLSKGAQPTDSVRKLCSTGGVMLLKHLIEGVEKGAIDKKVAHRRLAYWRTMVEKRTKKRNVFTSNISLESLIDALEDNMPPNNKENTAHPGKEV